ncbi:sensor domain-containing diguanylate cyclase [Nocardia brasiliensis]|uniref:sensor domain-containing diguanylate cyclase n=1 Tax=Nocardia brasiliensis TaxID=37326 RepID=UPI00142E83FA|nr:sensor domain-containing diguanylate cyclase [Nocardia brasiliensis]
MGSQELAVRWADALDGAVAPTGTRSQIEAMLAELAEVLTAVVLGTAEPAIARDAAAVLIAANYRDAVAVSRSVVVICRDLVDDLCPAHSGADYERIRDRAVLVAAEFAAGCTAALRSAALAEQEATLVATLAAAQEAEAKRQLSEARFAAVFAGASVGIGTIDVMGNVLDANVAMADMLGLPVEVMPGRSVADLLGPANIGYAFDELQRLLSGAADRFRLETDHLRPDGTVTTIDLSMSAVRDSTGQVRFLIGVAVDVTERKQLADRLWHDANHDSLTGLPNRTLFFDRLANADPPIGVCYLDLDGFKEINDVWGHTVGDKVLRLVGERLQGAVAAFDGLVARLGGDEFIVLIEKCSSAEQLAAVSAALAQSLVQPMMVQNHLVTVGASIGTVFLDEVPAAPDELMHAADTAMYRNKAAQGARPLRFRDR